MDKTGGCSPVIINFRNQTTGASSNATYQWDFGNGNTSTLTEGGAVYTDEKTYTVTLTVQDGSNQSTYQQQVTVYSPPKVDFSVSPAKTCLGMPVKFTPNATPGSGSIYYYTWDFGDGSTTTQYTTGPQSYTYGAQVAGAPVSLTVTNTYGCHTTLRKPNLVTIIAPLVSSFTGDKKVLCQVSDAIQFTNASTGPGALDYKWDFGDGTSSTAASPNHIFNKKGFYSVSLTVHSSEGCTITSTQSSPINVASYSTDFVVPSPICAYSSVTFNNLSTPAPDNTQWLLDGNPYYYGSYNMQWAPQGTDVGTHTLTLQNTFGTCPQSASKQISVKDVPHPVPFTSTIASPCGAPVSVSFKDPTPGVVKWEWDFNVQYSGPSYTGSGQTPSYTYTADGYYNVWLRNTTADGCSATTGQQIYITRPTVNILADPAVLSVCSSLMTITFHTNSSEALTATQWNFGDGGTSTDPNPTHGFKNTGSYTMTLNYTTVNGCKGTVTYKVYSVPPPNPVAVYTTPGNPAVCNQPITVTFSTWSSEPLTSTTWAFGDVSANSTAATPTHTYPRKGKYVATLNYVTQSGCKGTAYSNLITVDTLITKLDLTISPNPVCGTNLATFSTNPTADMDINSYTWDFGDGTGTYNSSSSMTHSYGQEGTYTAKVYALSVGGCDTTITKTVTVKNPFPHFDTHTNTCDGTRGDVTFKQSSVGATSIKWDFGDGTSTTTPGDQPTVTHTYKKSGSYTPTLTAINGTCALTTTEFAGGTLVLLKQNAKVTADKTSACSNTVVNIQIGAFDPNPYQTDNPYGYGYYAGYSFIGAQYRDGTPLSIPSNPAWDYRWTTNYTGTITGFKAGEKDIRFITTSLGFNCQDTTMFLPIAIKGAVGGFKVDADKMCYQSPVVLEDTSHSTPDNKILSWTWNFGDGNTLTQNTGGKITHSYVNPGAYYVTMQITDAAGCSSNVPSTQFVSVNGPKAAFYPSGTDVHLNTTVYFYNNTLDFGNTNTTYKWDFGDGSTSTDPYPSHTYTVPGTYTVTMSASNPSLPCSSTATPVTIIVRNFNSHFQYNSTYVAGNCPPLLVSFTNTSYNAVTVAWDFGDGNTAGNVYNPSHVYEKPGMYIVKLKVYTYNGLQGEYIDSVIIRKPSVVIPKLPPETCIGNTVTLSSNIQNGSNYTWDFGDGSIVASTDGNATHQYQAPGSYIPTLLVQNDAGCVTDTTLPDPVKIRPNPVAAISPKDPVICKGDSQPITASGGTIYQWSPAAGLSDPNSATPIANPMVTTDYTLTVKDDIGCRNTAPLKITVVQPGNLQLRPSAAICAGDTLQLNATGEMLYTWIGDTQGLDHTDIANPAARPTEDITYTVQGSDDHHCFVHTRSIVVTVHPLPTVEAGPDIMVEAGYDATLNATGSADVIRWQWTPQQYLSCYNCASPVCLPLATTEYIVKVENRFCKAYDTVVVAVDCQESHVRIPSAFTPNGDGTNDVFMIKGISIVKHMIIYDRWGIKVFERNNFIAGDRNSCWNGRYNGQNCAPGTYVYFAEMECPSGGTFARKGSFVLIR